MSPVTEPMQCEQTEQKKKAGLRIVLLREIPDDLTLHRRWNDLLLQMERPQVFYTCEWALAVQSAYRVKLKPLLFLAYEGDDLVGVASLATDAEDLTVTFLAANTADYCEFLSPPQRRAEFVEAVFAELRRLGMSRVVLANLPADSATLAALRAAAKKHGFHMYVRPAYSCPQVELGSAAQREELKNAISRKRQVRRCLKALEQEGPLTMTYLRSWSEIQAALPGFFEALAERFRTKGSVSFVSTSERRWFMEELARRCSGDRGMTLSMLMVGGRTLAWSYGFQFQGSWFLYQTTFDIRSEENSPGYCLMARILMEACDINTLNLVDMGLGAEAYKEWFANSSRQTLYATLSISSLRHWREIARHRMAAGVKRFPGCM